MLNDVDMLRLVMKNAEMGCRGINEVKHYANTDEMKRALKEQNFEYGKIYNKAYNMLRQRGTCGKRVPYPQVIMTKIVSKKEMKRDNSNSHIAEMMIQGNTMGVKKLAKNIHNYNKKNKDVLELANKFFATQQNNIEQMKSFL